LATTTALVSGQAWGAWHVDNSASQFNFVTTKAPKAGATAVDELQSFKTLSGTVGDDGAVQLNIDLSSVETKNPVRDQRIKDLLFKIAGNPSATFSGKVSMADMKKLHTGDFKDIDMDGQLSIAGQDKPVTLPLRVVALKDGALLVATRSPVIVKLADYGLQDGVEALRAAVSLDVLSDSAPVSFSIMLKHGK
jgi:polyisoprenoid-binding protein YceI